MKPRKKQMKTPHKHAEAIKAWADGAEIEYKSLTHGWQTDLYPEWLDTVEYRIKPTPKPDLIEEMTIYRNLNRRFNYERSVGEIFAASAIADVRLTFDGETGKLKAAEVI